MELGDAAVFYDVVFLVVKVDPIGQSWGIGGAGYLVVLAIENFVVEVGRVIDAGVCRREASGQPYFVAASGAVKRIRTIRTSASAFANAAAQIRVGKRKRCQNQQHQQREIYRFHDSTSWLEIIVMQ